ncbi:hypothetical protein HAX54_028439 [Datura stramonium]|uniref:Uncharacterized protein n=1 Tax=Datura stramonium TaxID=4076 RepID=A0ABS8V730_DATST|nr:hypothetical protein [Datura stramonium]
MKEGEGEENPFRTFVDDILPSLYSLDDDFKLSVPEIVPRLEVRSLSPGGRNKRIGKNSGDNTKKSTPAIVILNENFEKPKGKPYVHEVQASGASCYEVEWLFLEMEGIVQGHSQIWSRMTLGRSGSCDIDTTAQPTLSPPLPQFPIDN